MSRIMRWWWVRLLRLRGWPDPEGTLDWVERYGNPIERLIFNPHEREHAERGERE